MQQLQLPKKEIYRSTKPLWERLDTLDTWALGHGPTH